MKDFAYVGIITDGPYVLVANPKLGVSSVKELVALSKAKPGSINYASYGIGSMAQLNLEAFNQKLGTDMVHIPYKGAGPAAQAAVAGEVGVTIATVPAVQGFIKDGRLRALAVGSDKRFAVLPDVPTMAEAGASNDILVPTYFALLAPAGTPPAVVARLNAEMKKALADPQVVERLAGAGLVPNGGTPDADGGEREVGPAEVLGAREVDRDQAGVKTRREPPYSLNLARIDAGTNGQCRDGLANRRCLTAPTNRYPASRRGLGTMARSVPSTRHHPPSRIATWTTALLRRSSSPASSSTTKLSGRPVRMSSRIMRLNVVPRSGEKRVLPRRSSARTNRTAP